jgi:hypothetical protein
MDSIKDTRDNTTRQLQSAADSAAEFLDDGLASATHAAKQSVAIVRDNAEQVMEVGQVSSALYFGTLPHDSICVLDLPQSTRHSRDACCAVLLGHGAGALPAQQGAGV